MKAELRPDESAVAGTREIFLAQARAALDSLSGKEALTDEAVHEARKAIKRARATLRLLRPAIGDKFYAAENVLLRDAARPLTQVRDARIVVDTLEQVLAHPGKAAVSIQGSIQGEKLGELLRSERIETRKSLLNGAAKLKAIRTSLRGAPQRAQRWPILEDDWDALGPAIKRVYRAGRNALAEAKANRTDETLHEWRKRTKYLWHELQILQPLRPGLIGELAEQAHRLADALGDDHDLAVLRAKILGSHAAIAGQPAHALIELVDQRRAELQDKAFETGQGLYQKKPSAFAEPLEKSWHKWRHAYDA
jgi:CHAD domain-containing protein